MLGRTCVGRGDGSRCGMSDVMELDGCGYWGTVELHVSRSDIVCRDSGLGLVWVGGCVGDLVCNMVYSVCWRRWTLGGALVVSGGRRKGVLGLQPMVQSSSQLSGGGACCLVGITYTCPAISCRKEGVRI